MGVDTSVPPMFSPGEWQCVLGLLRLTPQQARVVGLIMQGKSDKQIAQALGRTVPTVRTHIAGVFDRLKLEDRVELVLDVFTRFRQLDGVTRSDGHSSELMKRRELPDPTSMTEC
jgi:DNA-binding CsgD family transcriptional regulator